jgi:hypothetical protein
MSSDILRSVCVSFAVAAVEAAASYVRAAQGRLLLRPFVFLQCFAYPGAVATALYLSGTSWLWTRNTRRHESVCSWIVFESLLGHIVTDTIINLREYATFIVAHHVVVAVTCIYWLYSSRSLAATPRPGFNGLCTLTCVIVEFGSGLYNLVEDGMLRPCHAIVFFQASNILGTMLGATFLVIWRPTSAIERSLIAAVVVICLVRLRIGYGLLFSIAVE